MSKRWLWLALAAAAWAQPQTPITREGKYWVETINGAGPTGGAGHLKVAARGPITLRGEARGDIAYTIHKRVRARSEREARELLRGPADKIGAQKDWIVLLVRADGAESADVHVRVPRRLAEVVLDSMGGAVEAYDLDGSLYVKTGGGQVQVDRIKGAVKVGTAGGQIRIGKVGGFVKGYSGGGSITADSIGGDAFLDTGGGEIFVREAKGRVQASAGGGNIRIQRADAGAVVNTASGLIDVYQSAGPVTATTSAGAIKIFSAANVRCSTGAGPIQLRGVHGPLRAAAAVGSIVAELKRGMPIEDSVLTTSSGDITVYIPSNFPVTVEATTISPGGNRIVSDFPEIRPRLASGNMRTEAQGQLGGGGPLLKLAAQGGTIYLRRRD